MLIIIQEILNTETLNTSINIQELYIVVQISLNSQLDKYFSISDLEVQFENLVRTILNPLVCSDFFRARSIFSRPFSQNKVTRPKKYVFKYVNKGVKRSISVLPVTFFGEKWPCKNCTRARKNLNLCRVFEIVVTNFVNCPSSQVPKSINPTYSCIHSCRNSIYI